MTSLSMRLDAREAPGEGKAKANTAVCPASHRKRNVIPEKAPEEWPEGKDLRASRTSGIGLERKKEKQNKYVSEKHKGNAYPVHVRETESH